MKLKSNLLGRMYIACNTLLCLFACGGPAAGDDPREVVEKMPRASIRHLKNVHLSIVSSDWRYAEPAQPSLKRNLDQEIRSRVGGSGFWATPASRLGSDPELVVIGSSGRIGTERTIMFLQAYVTEVVTVDQTKAKLRAITWYGDPWYGSAYPSVLERVVREGKNYVLADLEHSTGR